MVILVLLFLFLHREVAQTVDDLLQADPELRSSVPIDATNRLIDKTQLNNHLKYILHFSPHESKSYELIIVTHAPSQSHIREYFVILKFGISLSFFCQLQHFKVTFPRMPTGRTMS